MKSKTFLSKLKNKNKNFREERKGLSLKVAGPSILAEVMIPLSGVEDVGPEVYTVLLLSLSDLSDRKGDYRRSVVTTENNTKTLAGVKQKQKSQLNTKTNIH